MKRNLSDLKRKNIDFENVKRYIRISSLIGETQVVISLFLILSYSYSYSYSYSDQSSSRPRGPKPSGLPEETSYVQYDSPFCSGRYRPDATPAQFFRSPSLFRFVLRSHRSSTGGLAYSFRERVLGIGNELPYRLGLYAPASGAFGQHKYRG